MPVTTFTHDWIWRAIDTLASRHGLSPSGLAKLAGLDPTTFNRSKRITAEGRLRWPSTESISKILEATGTALDEFATQDVSTASQASHGATDEPPDRVPLIGEVRDAAVDRLGVKLFEFRRRGGTQRPPAAPGRFALTVADSSLEPAYSQGNTLIISLEAARSGHRVIVKPTRGLARAGMLLRATRQRIELGQFRPGDQTVELARADVEWIGRIIWARQ